MTNDDLIDYKPYLGNTNLKREGVAVKWTKEKLDEYLKCSKDPIYFIEKYMKLIHVDRGLVPFKMYDYQKNIVNSLNENRNTIVTAARQCGKTSTMCGFVLWYILFNDSKTVAILANKGETAREILHKIQLAYQYLPLWLQQGVVQGGWNKGSFALENNSRVFAGATSDSSIRGYAVNLLILDECAFIENFNEFFTSVYPTISSGKTTKLCLISTPNGMNEYYHIWSKAINNENDYNPITVNWRDVPGRDEEWKRNTLSALNDDMDRFNQEYENEFIGSSGTLISGWKLKELYALSPENQKQDLYQFYLPEKFNKYVLCADVAHGKGLDYCAFIIVDITKMPYQVVCSYKNNLISPGDYANLIYRMAKTYNNCLVLIEVNDLGSQIAEVLHNDLEYDSLLWTQTNGKTGKSVSFGFSKASEKGIRMTKKTKLLGCSMLKLLIEQNQLIPNDKRIIHELSTFIRKGYSYEAELGHNDDLAMCMVIFSWFTDQNYFKEYSDINTVKMLQELNEEELENSLTPFGFINDGDYNMPIEEQQIRSWMADDDEDYSYNSNTNEYTRIY